MQNQTPFLVARGARRLTSSKHLARIRAAASDAIHDFAGVWPTAERAEAVSVGSYATRPVVTVKVDGHDYIVSDGEHAQLVVSIVQLLQVVATNGNTQWPAIPGTGPLRATVRDGCAIWVTPRGSEFCEIGHLFNRTARELFSP